MKRTIIAVLGVLFIFYQASGFGVGYRTDEPGTTMVVLPADYRKSMKSPDAEVITVMESDGYTYEISYAEYKATYPNDIEPDFGIFTIDELEELIEK